MVLFKGSPTVSTFWVVIWQDVDISCWDEMWNWRALHWSSPTPWSKLEGPLYFPLKRRETTVLAASWKYVAITRKDCYAFLPPCVWKWKYPVISLIELKDKAQRGPVTQETNQVTLYMSWVLKGFTCFLSANLKLSIIPWNVHIFLKLNRSINELKQNGFVIPGVLAPNTTCL